MSDQKIGKVTIKSSPQPSLTNNVSSVSVKVNDQNTQRVNTIQYGGAGVQSTGVGQLAFDRANSSYNHANTGYLQANNAASFANGAFARANSAYNFANTLASSSGSFDRANSAYSQANSAYIQANNAASFANSAYAHANAAFEIANSDPSFANGAFTTANSAFLQANNSFNVANSAFNSANNRVLRAGDTMTGLLRFNTTGNTIVGPVQFDADRGGIDLFSDKYDGFSQLNYANTVFVWVENGLVRGETTNTSFELNESAKHFRVEVPGNTLELSLQDGLVANTNMTVTGEANVELMLHVGTGSYTLLPNLIAQFTGFSNYYSQINQQNLSANGSGDIVVTADNGTDFVNYIDMGIAGSTYINTTPNAFPTSQPNDGYLYMVGNPGANFGGNLVIGTAGSGSFADITFIQGPNFQESVRFVYGDGIEVLHGIRANGIVDGTYNLKDYTSLVYNYANTISYNVSLSYAQANAAFDAANNAGQYAQPAYNQANNAFNVANAAFSQANNAFNVTNVAFSVSNSAASFANGAFTAANNAGSFANSAYAFANTGYTQANNAASFANGAFTRANSSYDQANSAASFANGAFTRANSAYDQANTGSSFANSAFVRANSAYDQANSAASFANGSFTQANNAASFANGAFARANSAYGQANSAASFANGAFTLANTKFNSSGGTISGDVSVTGNLSVSGTVTSVNTQQLLVRDNIITLDSTIPVTVPAPSIDSGIEVNRGLYQNTQLVWSEVAGVWRMSDGNTFASIASANLTQAAFSQSNNAFNVANAAFLQANNSFNVTNVSFGVANSAASFANGSFITANSASSFANGAFVTANSAASFANGAFTQANNAASFANGAFARANSAYDQANSAASFANGAFVTANSAASFANGAFTSANNLAAVNTTQNTNITSAQSFANGAFVTANSAASFANGAFTLANNTTGVDNTQNTNIASAQSFANGAFSAANSAASFANGAFTQSNNAASFANSAYAFANTGYTQANNAASFANGAFTQANNAASFANGAFTRANSAASFANGAFTAANSAASFANGAFVTANSAASFANGAFVTANSAASFANGAFTVANSAASFANGAFVKSNSAFTQANNAFNVANAAFSQANNSFNVANVAYVAANNAGSFANSAYASANVKARVWESDTPPASANNYDIWVDSSNGVSYIYTTSNSTSVWVEYGPIGTPLSNLGDFTFNSQTMTGSYANQDVIIYQMGTGNIVLKSANTVSDNLIPNTAFSNIGTVANPWNKIVAANVTTSNVSVTGVIQVNNSTFLATSAAVSITGSSSGLIQTPSNDGYMLHITGKENIPTRTVIDAFGPANTYPLVAGRHARGTPSSPSAVQTGDVLLRLAGNGYGTTGFAPLGTARIDIVASENYTDTARGSQIKFYNVSQGTNTVNEIASFNADSVTFNGTITAGGGFAYTSRSNTSNSATQTINFATDSSVRLSMNKNMTISFTNYTTGKIVDLIVQNLDNNPHDFYHGTTANNSSKGTTYTAIPANSLLYCRYICYDGDLANTFAVITIG